MSDQEEEKIYHVTIYRVRSVGQTIELDISAKTKRHAENEAEEIARDTFGEPNGAWWSDTDEEITDIDIDVKRVKL